MKKINRRQFLGGIAGVATSLFIAGCGDGGAPEVGGEDTKSFNKREGGFDKTKLAIAEGDSPADNTRSAVESLGGMGTIVSEGDFVVVKPNMAWSRPADAAATTNPEVISEIVKMCNESGAGRVLVIDNIIDRPATSVFAITGIDAAVKAAGAELSAAPNETDYAEISIPDGKSIISDTCIKSILEADVFINVPVAKSHSSTRLTLGMKNLMGCNWDRTRWHRLDLDQCIADYSTVVRPDLVVTDATRILLTNGPKGPGETKDTKQVAASADPVAIDSWATGLFGLHAEDVRYIKMANDFALGEMDLAKMTVERV